ncbi:MAG TPA: hypothetical protein VD969_19620 [Symbiobacteriaceae bacterium]|nr:hypothetical protein [Symbiobacteriaceae bacterium]
MQTLVYANATTSYAGSAWDLGPYVAPDVPVTALGPGWLMWPPAAGRIASPVTSLFAGHNGHRHPPKQDQYHRLARSHPK